MPVGRLVRRLPDVLRVLLGRVVVAEGRLDTALGLRRVARLNRILGDEPDACSGPIGGHRGGKARGPAPDHEHVEFEGRGHGSTIPANS